MSVRRLPLHADDRGRLVVAEDADVGYPIRRVFAVTGVPAGVERGDHPVPCRQTLVLLTGTATVWTGDPSAAEVTRLERIGDAVDLAPGEWVRYALSGPDAVVMIFAEAPYVPRTAGGAS